MSAHANAFTIPSVDLRDFTGPDPEARAAFVRRAGDALREVGFFALGGHGVEPEVITRAYATARRFFELPLEQKLTYEKRELLGQRGYTAFGRERAVGYDAPDLKEFWHVGRELSPESEWASAYPQNLWPAEVAEFRSVFLELFGQLDRCARQLLEAVSLYLGEPGRLLPDAAEGGDTVLRIIHYPPIPAGVPPQAIRAAAHEDINLLTLLCEATAGGLELLQRDGSWLPVHAPAGQLIVDSGDMMQNLTNGVLRSTTHRVVNPDDDRTRRFSMPFFVHPRHEVSLTPLPGCVARSGGERRFPALTAGQFLNQRLSAILTR